MLALAAVLASAVVLSMAVDARSQRRRRRTGVLLAVALVGAGAVVAVAWGAWLRAC